MIPPSEISRVEPPRCVTCDSTEFLSDSFGQGGLNDVCRPCFYIWYDGPTGCERPEHRDQKPHVHGEDIRDYCLRARAAGTWPFTDPAFRNRDSNYQENQNV